jgi:hypothetical protein
MSLETVNFYDLAVISDKTKKEKEIQGEFQTAQCSSTRKVK